MKTQNAGFSLMELMVVVAIIGILSAFAYPSYVRYVDNAYRDDAKAALISLAAHLERRFTENNSYCDSGNTEVTDCGAATGDSGAPAFFATSVPLNGGTPIYNLVIEDVSPTSFEIRAVPVVGQRMANDNCGQFVYTNTGRKSLDPLVPPEPDDCW
jgi:type IV pilus assembly protein PilE